MADRWRFVPGDPGPAGDDPALGRGQRARRLVRDVIVDRLWLGPRFVRLPGRIWLVVDTVDGLQAADADGETTRLTVTVVWWVAPWPGWSGRIGPLDGVVGQRVSLPARGRGRVTVDIRLARPAPVRDIVAAALTALRPYRPLPAPGALAVPVGGANAVPAGGVLVDATRVNPRGRRPESFRADAPHFILTTGPVSARARARAPWGWPGGGRWRSLAGTLPREAVAALRCVGSVHCGAMNDRGATNDRGGLDGGVRAATVLAELAMTGVLVHAPQPPALLGKELRDILAEPLPVGLLDREIRSVRQRRAALREHSFQFGQWEPPTVSAILATRRAEMLPAILATIAGQTYPHLEIVLCLHGIDVPDPRDLGRPIEVVRVDGDVPFGEALGRATARASGTLITKFDDDDTYGPEHVWDLVLARHYSGATLVGKGTEFVYLEGADITVRRRSGQPEAEGTIVAGGTMLISRGELEELGGWRPVPRSVDRGLLDRVIRAGATIYRTHALGYLYHRRAQGHTWAADDEFFLRTARQRWEGLYAP